MCVHVCVFVCREWGGRTSSVSALGLRLLLGFVLVLGLVLVLVVRVWARIEPRVRVRW